MEKGLESVSPVLKVVEAILEPECLRSFIVVVLLDFFLYILFKNFLELPKN